MDVLQNGITYNAVQVPRIGSDAHVDGKYKAEDKRVDAT